MNLGINPLKQKALEDRMRQLGIRESDIKESFIRSGGHGGQNVNKTSTCVYLKHPATGIEVKCQQERSQAINRFLARRLLADKIEEKIRNEKSAHRQTIEKIRRQKRRRSRRSKEKILHDKHHHSEIKTMRSRLNIKEW